MFVNKAGIVFVFLLHSRYVGVFLQRAQEQILTKVGGGGRICPGDTTTPAPRPLPG